ncbi:hypothetical protein [Allocoleopsis franciscana]|uniref:Uncharacterized protein n=1 Tax=Allocoleopsis franciscana PCC 7113 TaxID=1173027 RepID=K9WP84_9CYAN|nr:hypothetical protein [Allocoleopsis franciscana]AFZ21574.1 hypothetical protein Mic7113_5972 [Allocoleopsis franciscana PCC 7113]
MPESSPDNRFSFSDSQGETTSWQPPLGLQQPLVTANPLGQSFLSPQFLSPLAAQPLGGGNPLGTSAQALPDYNLSETFFQDSPSLAESRLSLNPPETPVTAAATPTAGMDSTPVNIQRYPGETSTDNGHENNPIPAAPDSLSEAEHRLLGHDTQATTEEEQVASQPHEQLRASDTQPLNPTIVQPELATEPLLQREIAIPEAPEAVEPSRESLVSESESSVQIPEVAEEPSAIANPNPSVMRSADLSNVPPPQTSPVAPLPSLPADHLSGLEPIVSPQAELSPVHPIESAQDTEQNTQDVPNIPVQRQEDEASPPSLVESLPLASQALPDTSQSPQSFVQKEATADSPPPLNQPSAESPSAIMPVLGSDAVNVQPSVPPNSDSESVAIAQTETSDFPPSTAGESESLQESGITPSEPTVVQAFSETESSALSQTTAAPLESPALTQPQHHQSSTIGEPPADSSTPLAKPELETITPSSPPTLEEPQQRTETSRVDTDTAPSHSEIVQPSLEREPSAQSEAAFAPVSDATAQPEPLVSPVTQVSESPIEAIPVAESEPTIAQLFSEPESSESSEGLSSQGNQPSTSSVPTSSEESSIQRQPLLEIQETAADAIAPTQQEANTPADITSPTSSEESSIQRQPLLEIQETAADAIAPTQQEANTPADITSPTSSEESSIQRQPLPEIEETAPDAIAPSQEEAGTHPEITYPTSSEESSIQRQPFLEIQETAPDAIAPSQEEAGTHPDITSPTSSEESSIQRQPFLEIQETAPDAIAPSQEEAGTHPDITSPTSSEESSIQRQPLPQTEETLPDAIAPSQEEAGTPPEITSPTTPEESGIQRQLLPETQETLPDAIAPSQEAASTPAEITSPTTPEESSIQRQPLPQTEETLPDAIAPSQEEAGTPPEITSPTTPEESGIQRQLLPETQETLPDAIAPSQEEAIAPPEITYPTSSEESSIQRQPLPEIEETAADAIAPTQEEAGDHPEITYPTSSEESSIQRQPLPEIEETAADAIAPTQEEAGDHPEITYPTSSEESSIQRQPLPEIEETAADAIAPTQEEAGDHPEITYPTSSEESSIQRQPLPQTDPVQTASTPSASETELPSSISQAITTDSTLVMPKALPDETAPVSYPTQAEPFQATEISQHDENTSLTELIIAQPLLENDANWQPERLPTTTNSEEAQDNSPQASPISPKSPPLPTHLLQTKTNVTEDESFKQNKDVPQLPTVLENLVGTRHTLPLIQPLNQHLQQSPLLSTASTLEFSREQSTIVQSMPETSHRLVVPSTTSSTLPDNALNQAQQSTVKVPPVSLDTESLTLQRATDAISKTTPEFNQQTQQVASSTYTSEIPNSWSSIAELLENTNNFPSDFGGETPIQMAFNDVTNQQSLDWQESNNWENLLPEYSRSSEASSTFSQETPIQKFTIEEASVQDENSATEAATQHQDYQHEDDQNLELLAREVYTLVRQRLSIERERHGHY